MKLWNFLITEFSYFGGLLVADFALSTIPSIFSAHTFGAQAETISNSVAPWLFLIRVTMLIWFIQFSLRLYFGLSSGDLLIEGTRRHRNHRF